MPRGFRLRNADRHRLNESPSEKEGKCLVDSVSEMQTVTASMKVPPKRKGNLVPVQTERRLERRLNESPSEKEGKWECQDWRRAALLGLNESPSEKEGKSSRHTSCIQ